MYKIPFKTCCHYQPEISRAAEKKNQVYLSSQYIIQNTVDKT